MKDLMSLLFETNAFKICEENKPFWYTSGKIGPYFVNTHFLYGSENDANELLDFINEQLATEDKTNIPTNIFNKVLHQYETNEIFKTVIDELKAFIEDKIPIENIDYISGGERRDWYFSNIIAYLLGKPHITIYKDLSTVVSTCDFTENTEITHLESKKVLHIADLLNQSSSYVRAWVPAIKQLGSSIVWSTVVVDRMQGGSETLTNMGVRSLSLLQIDETLFNKALELNIINEAGLTMLNDFTKDPDGSMRTFLLEHPEFLENALNSDEKTAKRAKLCIESNLYNLND